MEKRFIKSTMRLAAAFLLLLSSAHMAHGACVLRLTVDSKQSPWSGGGNNSLPQPGVVTQSNLTAAGTMYLQVPTTSCPPADLSASNAQQLLEKSSLLTPVDGKALSFTPVDIKSNVTAGTSIIASLDFNDLQLGLTGNEPLGSGAVVVGAGTAAEAQAAAQPVCSQLVLLAGVFNITSSLVGIRTADVKHVAFNRTAGVGVSIKQGDPKLPTVLYIDDASMFLNISRGNIPGVEVSRATYLLSGDVVATADLANKNNWVQVDDAKADWSRVERLDAPVVINPEKPAVRPQARIIGVNSKVEQQCTPTRALTASGDVAAAPELSSSGGGSNSAETISSLGLLRVLMAGIVGAVLAVLAL